MIDHNLYASPVQASQALITHILEAMDKEPERPFTIALSGGTTPATLFEVDRKSTRLNSSHNNQSRMPSSA